MAKRLMILAAGALALTACTSQDVIEEVGTNRSLIQFENVVSKPTRADLTSTNLAQFNVFGFYTMPANPNVANEIFDDVTVYRQPDGVTWSYMKDSEGNNIADAENRYWVKDAKYYFYAYSCGNVSKLDTKYGEFELNMEDGLAASDRTFTISNYVCDNTHQHDLIFASNTGATETDSWAGILGKENTNSPVSLQFRHILSKVKARFTTKFPAEYEVKIKNISVNNIRNTGTFTPTGGWKQVLRPDGEAPKVSLLGTGSEIAVSNKKVIVDGKQVQAFIDSQEAFVIPYEYSGADVTLYFEIEVYKDNEKAFTKVLTGKFNPAWVAGCSYIYNVEISGDSTGMQAIVFTTATDENGAVIEWNEDSTQMIVIDK